MTGNECAAMNAEVALKEGWIQQGRTWVHSKTGQTFCHTPNYLGDTSLWHPLLERLRDSGYVPILDEPRQEWSLVSTGFVTEEKSYDLSEAVCRLFLRANIQ